MVSTSGSQLLPAEAVKELREDLLPLTTILTPNIPEARLLLHSGNERIPHGTGDLDEMINLAKQVQKLGGKWVLLKGGHFPLSKDYGMVPKDEITPAIVVDVLTDGTQVKLIETEYLYSKNTHGTGCSLACELFVYFLPSTISTHLLTTH